MVTLFQVEGRQSGAGLRVAGSHGDRGLKLSLSVGPTIVALVKIAESHAGDGGGRID